MTTNAEPHKQLWTNIASVSENLRVVVQKIENYREHQFFSAKQFESLTREHEKLKHHFKKTEQNQERYRNERNQLRDKLEKQNKEMNERPYSKEEEQLRRDNDDLRKLYKDEEKEWEQKIKDSEHSANEIIKFQRQKLEKYEEEIKKQVEKAKQHQESIKENGFESKDTEILRKQLQKSKKQLKSTNDRLQRVSETLTKTQEELDYTKTRPSTDVNIISSKSTIKYSTSIEDFEKIEHCQSSMQELLKLLTTKVPELVEKAKQEIHFTDVNTTEVAKLERENEGLRRELDTSRKITDKYSEMKKRYDDLQKKFNESEEKNKKLKDIERKYLEYKDELQKAFDKEEQKLQLIINEQKDKIQALEHAESKTRINYRERNESRTTDKRESERYSTLEKQLKDTREKLRNTEAELDDTKSRLSRALGNKLIDNNPNIADLSDRTRPTKLAEVYQEIYDNEWAEAFERLIAMQADDEEAVISTLVTFLVETKSVCEKEAEKQMTKIQQAITQDDRKVDAKVMSSINKPLMECRKAVAVYSGTQVYKKHLDELKYSTTFTAIKAKSVPKYLEACFNLCWLMTAQDPPLCFGPDVRRGDVFDTDLYKAYTQRGNTVAYVVRPALLLHKGGAVLRKGVAQGKADHSQQPKSAPNLNSRQTYLNYETDKLVSGSGRYHTELRDDTVADVFERLEHYKTFGKEPIYDSRNDESQLHRHETFDSSLSDLGDTSYDNAYKRDQGYNYSKNTLPYDYYKSNTLRDKPGISSATSSRHSSRTTYIQKPVTPRHAWKY